MERVVAINPYDYARGQGIRRSSPLAGFLFTIGGVPVLGPSVMRMRQLPIELRIFRGCVTRDDSIPPALVREMYQVGNRRGHNRAFRSLLSHAAGWEQARKEYARIEKPVFLIYAERDWSLPGERGGRPSRHPRRRVPGRRGRTAHRTRNPEPGTVNAYPFCNRADSPTAQTPARRVSLDVERGKAAMKDLSYG